MQGPPSYIYRLVLHVAGLSTQVKVAGFFYGDTSCITRERAQGKHSQSLFDSQFLHPRPLSAIPSPHLPLPLHPRQSIDGSPLKCDLCALRIRFARHSLTDIVGPASPGRALQTVELDSRIMPSPLQTTTAVS
jgi:hypothetical protein